MTTIQYSDRKEWEFVVKHHAQRIRGMISHQVFGWSIAGNKDAEIVAIYLKGVEEGRKHSEAILQEIIKRKDEAETKAAETVADG